MATTTTTATAAATTATTREGRSDGDDTMDAMVLRRLYYYGAHDGHARDVFDAPVVQQLHDHLRDSTLTPYCTRAQLMGSRGRAWSSTSTKSGQRRSNDSGSSSSATTVAPAAGAAAVGAHNAAVASTWPHRAQHALPPLAPSQHTTSEQPPPPPSRALSQTQQQGQTQSSAQSSTPSRARCPHSLFGATRRRGSSRYRAIADLELFMATGVLNERTLYFADAMQRRSGGAAGDGGDPLAPLPSQCVLSLDTATDPRGATLPWQRPTSSQSSDAATRVRATDVVPRRALLLKYNYERTTGMVKPYAMGTSYHASGSWAAATHGGHALDYTTQESSMKAYIAAMRCHRPTKGVFALHQSSTTQ